MRWFILRHPFLFWTVSILTLGIFYAYQKGWENGVFHVCATQGFDTPPYTIG